MPWKQYDNFTKVSALLFCLFFVGAGVRFLPWLLSKEVGYRFFPKLLCVVLDHDFASYFQRDGEDRAKDGNGFRKEGASVGKMRYIWCFISLKFLYVYVWVYMHISNSRGYWLWLCVSIAASKQFNSVVNHLYSFRSVRQANAGERMTMLCM